MTQNGKLNAVLAIAAIALALSIYTAIRGAARGPDGATSAGHACVDREARDQTDKLRKMLIERDALVTRLARAADSASGPSTTDAPGQPAKPGPSQPSSPPASPPNRGPRRYTHFEVPNPAVTVTQKDNGTYDIRTTDPKLSGTTLRITAVTATGDEDTLFIRIP